MVFSAIPQVITEDRASGAQVIDGSLKFDGATTPQYLTRTLVAGNRKTWTMSYWFKYDSSTNGRRYISTGYNVGKTYGFYIGDNSNLITFNDTGTDAADVNIRPRNVIRDNGWYHLVFNLDTTRSNQYDRARIYINGVEVTDWSTDTRPAQNAQGNMNNSGLDLTIGCWNLAGTYRDGLEGQIAQFYHIDGQSLGPGYFGFTDPLTGTWRPKKFRAEGTTVNDGTVWSDLISAGGYVNSCGPTKAFDGSIDSSDQTDGCKPTDDDTATLTLGTTIHGKIRVYFHRSGSGNVDSDIVVDGIGVGSNVNSTGWYELPVDSLRTLSWKHRSGVVGYSLQAIEVNGVIMRDSTTTNLEFGTNGFYLPMDGNSPIGEDKSGVVTPNDGTTWSDLSSATNITAGNVAGFFQGDTSSCSSLSLGTSGVFLLTKDIPNVTKIGLHSNTGAAFTMKVNEGLPDAYTATVPSRNNVSILDEFTGFTGTIHTLSFSGFGAGVCLNAIEINGHLLIDGKKGNDFTPVNFGGSLELPKATGAIPILNTNGGGTVARSGARTDGKTYTVTASGGKYYLDGVETPTLNAYRGGTYIFDYTGATSHPLYLSSLPDGKHNSKAYSVSFDGTGDALRVADHADLRFGTGAFTIECYVWFNQFDDTYPSIISKYTGGTASWIMRVRNLGYDARAIFYTGVGGGTNNESTTAPIAVNRWHHIAMVREGTGSNQSKMYVDGALVLTCTDNTDYTDTQEITIGAQNASDTNVLNGYMSNVRIIKGTALYTSNFTPPGTTLTNVTGTKLLCCQDSDATTAAVIPSGSITVAGNPAVTQSKQPFLYDNNHGNFGVNTATSNVTKITVPHIAADTLHYYCQNHSGMGSSINVTTDIFKADPYAWKNILALPLVGIKDDVSNQINSESTVKATSIANNAVASNASSNFYGGSFYFDGTGDDIDATITALGTRDFTLECWNETTATSALHTLFEYGDHTSNGFIMGIRGTSSSNNIFVRDTTSGSAVDIANATYNSPYSFGRGWHHFALQRAGNVATFFVDGIRVGTATYNSNYSSTNLRIGNATYGAGSAEGMLGYIQDVRLYDGIAKYSASADGERAFIVPATNPDILPDTPSGITGKTNLTKITDGAVAFDGSGDYLLVEHADMAMGTGDFTIEFSVYNKTNKNYNAFISTRETSNGTSAGFVIASNASGDLYVHSAAAVAGSYSGGAILPLNQWCHVAYTRSGGTHRLFLNGVATNNSTTTVRDYTEDMLVIGDNGYAKDEPINGFISNVRVIKGTALYTSNFTPPTSPLTNVTNTKLLCCQSNATSGAAAVSPQISGVNNGTVWSHYVTSDSLFRSGFPGWKAFNGTTKSSTNDCAATPQTAGQGFTFTFGGGVPFTTLQMQCDPNGSGGATVTANGVDITSQLTNGSLTNTTITGVTSPLTSLSLVSNSGDAGYLGSITIDSTMLVDPVNTNGNAAATNFDPFTDDINTIRGQASGYAILNPLDKLSHVVLSNGNLKWTCDNTAAGTVRANISVDSGKWYWEVTVDNGNRFHAGVLKSEVALLTGDAGTGTTNWVFRSDGYKVYNGSESSTNFSNVSAIGNVIQLAYDADGGNLWFGANGRWFEGNPSSLSSPSYTGVTDTAGLSPFLSRRTGDNGASINFGQKPFKFPPPDGFQPLSLSNVQPEKVIARPDQYVQANIWSGDNTTRNFDIGMKPDFVWIKCRSDAAGHRLFDSVRGPRNSLRTSSQDGQDTVSNFGYVSSFNNNGFTLTPGGYSGYESGDVNMTGRTYVGWTWKAGGSKNTFNIDGEGYATATAAGLDSGTTNPIGASVGTKQGFSIIRYTGNNANRTIAHGLSEPPKFWIYKNLTDSANWPVNHTIFGSMRYLYLNLTNTQGDSSSSYWGNMPTSDVLYIGADNDTNGDGDDHILYLWHDVPGLQKFGKWTNNNSNDGAFIELGFRPALILLKNSDNVEKWYWIDSSRHTYNEAVPSSNAAGAVNTLQPNTTNTEATSRGSHTNTTVDILSNGFKIRTTNPASGEISFGTRNYIYAAWAEAPSINLYGAQANAR